MKTLIQSVAVLVVSVLATMPISRAAAPSWEISPAFIAKKLGVFSCAMLPVSAQAARTCSMDGQCPIDQTCYGGVCRSSDTRECSMDGQCRIGQNCIDGVCRDDDTRRCNSDSQCPRGQDCISGVCEVH